MNSTAWLAERVLLDELDDGSGVVQSVGVVTDAGFADELNGTAEGGVALVDEAGVFLPGHDVVGIAKNVEEWDFLLG
jgi:hypothetical protein